MANPGPAALPRHLGIIMDGNGRWATSRKLPRSEGHKQGLEVARAVTKAASDAGLRVLTLYVFSTENWKRAESEVSYLMFLLKSHLLRELDFYRENRIRVVHSGDVFGLPGDIAADLKQVARDTEAFDGLTVNLAINYGGQDEIVRAARRWRDDPTGPALDVSSFQKYLDQPELPPMDLVIRTAGELRLSNFLLWQGAYAEFVFSEKLWPDWSAGDLAAALDEFGRRKRRFGGHDE